LPYELKRIIKMSSFTCAPTSPSAASWDEICSRLQGFHLQEPGQKPEEALALREQRIAPTVHYLNTLSDEDRGKLDCYIKELPVSKIIARESEFLTTHVPVYTAFHKSVFLLHSFAQSVLSLIPPPTSQLRRDPRTIVWFRNPLARIPARNLGSTVSSLFALRAGLQILDNTPPMAWQLISCNPLLFGNVLEDEMESTADYYWNASSVSAPKIEDIVLETLDSCKLLEDREDVRERLILDLTRTLELISGERGILYQLFIPHDEVNKTLYVCGKNGKPYEGQSASALETLLSLQYKKPEEISNYTTMQVRALANRLINPNVASEFPVFHYTDVNEAHVQAFRKSVDQIVRQYLL
jgi:hypothetical protein